jgi:hypothetical protein
MSAMATLMTAIAVVGFVALVAIAVWIHRRDDEEFDQSTSTMTDDERRAAQVAIGLTSGGGSMGH